MVCYGISGVVNYKVGAWITACLEVTLQFLFQTFFLQPFRNPLEIKVKISWCEQQYKYLQTT